MASANIEKIQIHSGGGWPCARFVCQTVCKNLQKSLELFCESIWGGGGSREFEDPFYFFEKSSMYKVERVFVPKKYE